MVKPIIALLSLGLGAGAAGLMVELQTHPQLLLTTPESPSHSLAAALIPRPAAPVSAVVAPEPSHIVTIDEVTVYGRAPTHPSATPRRSMVATNAPKATPAAIADTETRVIAPPCVDGQYRQLEEHRGVRLTCLGSKSQ